MPMIDDWLLSLIYAAWLAASTMPLGFMLGSSCSPCCGGCGVADGKPRTDPKDEGTWVPSGTWGVGGGVTWSFTANPGDESGETWFFYGSSSTSRAGGNATSAERLDWGNICNWYSNKTSSPSTTSGLPGAFDKRANRLPPETATVFVYSQLSTDSVGPQVVKNIYFFGGTLLSGSITTTSPAHSSNGGAVFALGFGGVALSSNAGTVNGGATFEANFNYGTVNDGAEFYGTSSSSGTVNGGATFYGDSNSSGTVNGGATFNDNAYNHGVGTVTGGATFNDTADNSGTVDGGATFNNNSNNLGGTVNDGAIFNDDSDNEGGTVNGGATFNDNSINSGGAFPGTVNGGATFNDAACSRRTTGNFFATPCTKKFVAHPTDLPTCNGTAPDGCANAADTCGCG